MSLQPDLCLVHDCCMDAPQRIEVQFQITPTLKMRAEVSLCDKHCKRFKSGDPIYTIAVSTDKDVAFVRNTLKKARAKLPCRTSIVVTKINAKPAAEQVEEEIEENED